MSEKYEFYIKGEYFEFKEKEFEKIIMNFIKRNSQGNFIEKLQEEVKFVQGFETSMLLFLFRFLPIPIHARKEVIKRIIISRKGNPEVIKKLTKL